MYHKSFWWKKKGRGTEASDKPEEPQYLCASGSLQNGGSAHPSRPHPSSGLDDKNGLEGCLPSGTNPPGVPTSSPVSMERESVSIPMPSVRADISATGFLKGDETCSGDPKTYGHSADYLPGRYSYITPGKGGTYSDRSTNLPVLQDSGAGDQPEEINFDSPAEDGVLGVCSRRNNFTSSIPSREAEEDSTAGTTPSLSTNCFSKRISEVCRKDLSITESGMASPSPLPSTTVSDKLCGANRPVPTGGFRRKIQYQLETHQRGQGGPDVVELSGQKDSLAIPIIPQTTKHDNRVRCFQYGMGSSTRRASDRGEMVHRGSFTSHKLSGAISCLSSSTMFCQTQPQYNHSDEIGQCHGSDIHQQARGNPLTSALSACPNHMGLVHSEGNISTGRTPAWEGQCNSGSGVEINEGSLRLDAEPCDIQSNPTPAPRDRLVCFPVDEAAIQILQLETRPRGTWDRCIPSGLVSDERIFQSPVVSDSSLSESNKETSSQSGDGHTIVALSAMVPHHPGNVGGFSQNATSPRRPSGLANRPGIHNESGGSSISGMAHIRESFTSRGISAEASNLLLSSWRPKTKSNYNSLFAKWAGWCAQRNRDPFSGPVEDVINFLAELFREGYLYRSLNSYRSAISAIHSKVDGQPVGQHPLVTRMLQGAFNERPPLPRYATVWDVGVVLRYLRGLGENGTLSL